MLTDDDIHKLTNALSAKPGEHIDRSKIIDWLFRLLLGVLVWLAVQLQGDVAFLKTEIQKISTEKIYNERDMDLIKQYINKPIFTKTDFDTQLAPALIQINRNSIDVNALMQFKEDAEKRITTLELKR